MSRGVIATGGASLQKRISSAFAIQTTGLPISSIRYDTFFGSALSIWGLKKGGRDMLGKIVKGFFKNQQQRDVMYIGIAPGIDGACATGNSLDECRHNLESRFPQGRIAGQPMKIFTGTTTARRLHFRTS
jgi:hypothetical protein